MKSFVLSAVICAATIGNNMASAHTSTSSNKENKTELSNDKGSIDTFKEQILFHQRNVDVLWHQYGLAEARIKESLGNHAELDREKTFFKNLYEQDIAEGIRVEESKKAIAEIEAIYAEKHEQRSALENKKIAVLQAQLRKELRKEEKRFESSKKKYARLINEQTLPLLRQAEQHFAQSIQRADNLGNNDKLTIVAAAL